MLVGIVVRLRKSPKTCSGRPYGRDRSLRMRSILRKYGTVLVLRVWVVSHRKGGNLKRRGIPVRRSKVMVIKR
jgi:hypothetical protein